MLPLPAMLPEIVNIIAAALTRNCKDCAAFIWKSFDSVDVAVQTICDCPADVNNPVPKALFCENVIVPDAADGADRVPPEYVLTPPRVKAVAPVFVSCPAPLMTPFNVEADEIAIWPAFICVGPV